MGINIVNGQDKDLIIKLTDKKLDAPFDLTGADEIRACFKIDGDGSLKKIYLPILGDTLSASDIISNISDTSEIFEGAPISGPGIPVNSTVLKTPDSVEAPTAAGTIQISANATATAAAVSLLIGDIEILSALFGKFKIPLHEEETDQLINSDFEVKVVKGGVTSYVVFKNKLTIVKRIC